MRLADYPEVFRAADKASLRAQQVFAGLKIAEIALLVASAAASGVNSVPTDVQNFRYWVTIVSVGGAIFALLIAIFSAASNIDSVWIDSRTLAESVKKLTWQFMMCIPPHGRLDPRAAEAEFHFKLESLRKAASNVDSWVAHYTTHDPDITDTMRLIRAKIWQEQHIYYRKHRLRTQISWYSTHSNEFSNAAFRYMVAAIILEAGAVGFAIAAWKNILPLYNGVGLATTVAAAAMAWSELRKHRQLGRTYHDIARRLSAQRDLARHVDSDETRIQFVDSVESIISTENTNWAIIRS